MNRQQDACLGSTHITRILLCLGQLTSSTILSSAQWVHFSRPISSCPWFSSTTLSSYLHTSPHWWVLVKYTERGIWVNQPSYYMETLKTIDCNKHVTVRRWMQFLYAVLYPVPNVFHQWFKSMCQHNRDAAAGKVATPCFCNTAYQGLICTVKAYMCMQHSVAGQSCVFALACYDQLVFD